MPRAIIDLGIIRENARAVTRNSHPATLMAVVKANAYGHGAVPVARALADDGVNFFAVATIEEAVELRQAGVEGRILVMTPFMPGTSDRYLSADIDATIGSDAGLAAVLDGPDSGNGPGDARLRVHLKIDTGMGRIGVRPDIAAQAIGRLQRGAGAKLVGVSTHLSSADENDLTETRNQIAVLRHALDGVDLSGLTIHLANTESVARVEEAFRSFDRMMVRSGIGLYGCPIRPDTRRTLGLLPAMTLQTEVTNVKHVEAGTSISYNRRWTAEHPGTIATVGIGYADGYRRSLFGRGMVGIAGNRYPVVGTICMDSMMVDLGANDDSVCVGDKVILFGEGGPDISEVSEWAGTIPYEILCGLGLRVERQYIGHPAR